MNVLACGTKVTLRVSNYSGTVIAICIRDSFVTYEISYYANGSYCAGWFTVHEFDFEDETKTITVGFIDN